MHDNLLYLMGICSKYPSCGSPYRIYINVFDHNEDCFCVHLFQTKEYINMCKFNRDLHIICIYVNEEGYEVTSSYFDVNSEGSMFPNFVYKEDIGKYIDHLLESYVPHL